VWLENPQRYGLQNFHPPLELSQSSLYMGMIFRAGGSTEDFLHTFVPLVAG
jgi:hypothetical protein